MEFKKQIRIFVISSSIDSQDILRAQNNSDVRDYILKPVTPEKFSSCRLRADSRQHSAYSLGGTSSQLGSLILF